MTIKVMEDWQQNALTLLKTGLMSKRAIAKAIKVPRSTVIDYFRKYEDFVEDRAVDSVYVDMTPKQDNSRILWLTDLHAPFSHKNTLQFLRDLHAKYNFTRIICAGDEADSQATNMHSVNPDLPSAGDELAMTKDFLKELAGIFPVMDLLESNHTSLAYRRAFKAGISKGYMKNYNEIFDAPVGWRWHDDLMITLPNGQDCYFCHGKSSDGLKLSRNMSCNVAQGHFHSKFAIQYWSNPNNLYWSMQAGCLVDDKSMALAYNKLTLERPIIGVGAIINSHPILIPMEL